MGQPVKYCANLNKFSELHTETMIYEHQKPISVVRVDMVHKYVQGKPRKVRCLMCEEKTCMMKQSKK